MIKKNRILALLFLACAGVSFLYYVYNDKVTLQGLTVPINVNIELDKAYSNSFFLVNEPSGRAVRFLPTHPNKLQKIVIHARITELVEGVYVRIPLQHSEQGISSIDSVSIFLGNKLFYFNSSDIPKWEYAAHDGSAYYTIPIEPYKTSLIKPWINWYGDLSFIAREFIALITQPGRFIFVYLFALAAFFLLGRETNMFLKTQNKKVEIGLLIVLIAFGFLLRMSELAIKQSAWIDELWSLHWSGYRVPLKSIFADPSNPPFYYLVLRLWFVILGWSETAGRLLSVFCGTTCIIVLYWFVKPFCGKKYAFSSAFLFTIGYSSVRYSVEMRSYIFQMVLALCTAKAFFYFLKKQTLKRKFIYAIMGALLVNTHLFGVLFIAGNFFFYIKQNRHILNLRSTIHFIVVNLIIALSLVPYFYITGLQGTLTNREFTAWIRKPGEKDFFWPVLFSLIYIVVTILTLKGKKNASIPKKKYILFDYSAFLFLFVYLSALFFSLYRPILQMRYLLLCYPFIMIIAAAPFFIDYGITLRVCFWNYKSLAFPVIALALIFIMPNYINVRLNYFATNNPSDIYRESQEYINLDSRNYRSATQIVLSFFDYPFHEVYDLFELPRYSKQNHCDVVYMNLHHYSQDRMDSHLLRNGLNPDCLLKIRTGRADRPIYKVLVNP